MNAKRLFLRVFGFFFPNVCFSCGRIIGEGKHLCDECEETLLDISAETACPFCGIEKPDCDCAYSVYYFKSAAACFYNEGSAKNLVYNYKLGRKDYYCGYLADFMSENIKTKFKDVKFDYIVSVPPTAKSLIKRGFDQTRLLAKCISKRIGVPLRNGVIGCRPFNPSQHESANYKERFKNVKGKYYVKKRINAENVLLVDDIKSTGATLDACARELLYSGAKRVYCVTFVAGGLKS